MQEEQLKRIVEAALLASSQPLTLAQLGALFGEDEAPAAGALARAIGQLREECAGRGVELVEVASGFRYQVCEDVHPWVSRMWAERPPRYSRALLETLALIAYRQPVTRGEIEQVRGVVVSTNIIRTLEEREWVRVVGYRDVPGKPALYGTTKAFLDYFNLKSLDQLPTLSEIRDMASFEPQLSFDADEDAIPALAAMPDDDGDDDDGNDATEFEMTEDAVAVASVEDAADEAATEPDAAENAGTDEETRA
jgi:segregation and condensation protein B